MYRFSFTVTSIVFATRAFALKAGYVLLKIHLATRQQVLTPEALSARRILDLSAAENRVCPQFWS